MSVVREIKDLMARISRVEQQVSKLPSRISSAVGGSGSGGTTEWMKTAEAKEDLEEPVAEVYFGRVTDGDQKGMVCVRNPENDGWDAINFFE